MRIAAGNYDPKRRAAMLADFGKHIRGFDDGVAGLIWELRPAGAVDFLAPRLVDGKLSLAQRLRVVEALAETKDPKVGHMLLEALKHEAPAEVQDRILSG